MLRRATLFVMIAGVSWGQSANNDWTIVPGVRVGPINSTTTEPDLRRIFGAANVKTVMVDVGEGFQEPGTAVFGGTPNRMLQILWTANTPKRPSTIRICSEAATACQWHAAQGITMHTDLRTVEKVNGRPFPMFGFAWDYAGTVPGWGGGKLDAARGRLLVRLEEDRQKVTREELESVLGDREFVSSHPVMQKMNPRIYEMIQDFGAR